MILLCALATHDSGPLVLSLLGIPTECGFQPFVRTTRARDLCRSGWRAFISCGGNCNLLSLDDSCRDPTLLPDTLWIATLFLHQ